MVSKLRDLESCLKEQYKTKINRTVKKKIVNAWRSCGILRTHVNDLSLTLLGEEIPGRQHSEKTSERKVRISKPAKLMYKGSPDSGPEEMQWITDLLASLFKEKEITSNACEGTFGNMGTYIRAGRSIKLERALTKSMFHSDSVQDTVCWLNENYLMGDMGRRAKKGGRVRIMLEKIYKITYEDRKTVKSERIIDATERKRKYITAYCHLRGAVRTFKRSRIKYIEPA